jgi:sec-independent protein translocase protein TatC
MALASVPRGSTSSSIPPDLDDEDDDSGGKMSFLEHLDELRRRIIVSVGAVFVGFLVALIFIERIFGFIMRPLQAVLPHGGKLIYTEPAEAFLLYMKIAALVGLFLAMPIVLYQIWMFVAPGLYAHEKRFAIPFVVFASVFFLGGALFSHYVVFPWAWRFFAQFSTDYMEFTPKIASTFSLYVRMMLAMALVFEMPTVVLFLARVGLVTPRLLIRNTKYAVLVIFVIAAVLTPGPDVVSQLLMAAPMIVLYALSIVIAWIFQRRSSEDAA